MDRPSFLKTSFLSVFAALAFLIATEVRAAGSLTITQTSPIGIFGEYVLYFPSGGQVLIRGDETKTFATAEAGAYILRVTPPTDARFSATVTNGAGTSTTSNRNVTFTVADGDTTEVTLAYTYNGTIIVMSDPEGASFELLGPNNLRLTGIAPVTFSDLSPGMYRATFQRKSGCNFTPPIERALSANETLTFTGIYTCGRVLPPVTSSSSSSSSSPSLPTPVERTVRIWAAGHQAEVLRGGTARFAITVKNTGTRTLHDLVISAQFDPTKVQPPFPLPRFGTLDGGGNVVIWHVSELYAGKIWSVNLPMIASEDLAQGDRIAITARVSGSDTTTMDENLLVSRAEIGVAGLPQTGMRFDILFLIAILALSPLLITASRKIEKENA
jgi:hypothetical protein